MLHIVNGDSFGTKLRASGIDGDILVWRESLIEGPVFVDFSSEEARCVRRKYFAERGIPERLFQENTESQEAELDERSQNEEGIVLWFEHDLYDQIMLIHLLYRLRETAVPLYLLCIDSFPGVSLFSGLGQLTPEQTAELHGTWKPVTAEQLTAAQIAWEAYAGGDPLSVQALLEDLRLECLPFLVPALQAHLQKFPSYADGLDVVQSFALSHIDAGITNPLELFKQFCEKEHRFGLGDVQFWACLQEMTGAEHPLIQCTGGSFPPYNEGPPSDMKKWMLSVTSFGYRVLAGTADHVAFNGIDRWLGGCRLLGRERIWRWDEINSSFVLK